MVGVGRLPGVFRGLEVGAAQRQERETNEENFPCKLKAKQMRRINVDKKINRQGLPVYQARNYISSEIALTKHAANMALT